ncbi:MMPL family transporter [Barrientosiimonas humi]|uniref:MMPL family transporter n=1 Tax=Barrientosiimonas humi TaxID=999931 RepID=UPI00370D550A
MPSPRHLARSERGAGRGRWWLLALVIAWLVIGGIGGPTVGQLSSVQENENASFLPGEAESTRAAAEAADLSPATIPYFVVVSRDGGLRPSDRTAVQRFASEVAAGELAPGHPLSDYLAQPQPVVVPNDPQRPEAVLAIISLRADRAEQMIGEDSPITLAGDRLRGVSERVLEPAGLTAYVTGPGGFITDLESAFAGIDGLLLLVALGVVFVILLLVYRSPLLPIAVLVSSVFGLALAALVIYPLADRGTLELSGQSQGILFILVVGAATDYALLLVSRYREELHRHERPMDAMRVAWRASLEPIAASAATVVLGLLCLSFSELGNTRSLGPVGALGIAGALLSALTFLPSVLVLAGRRIFWPAVPRHDDQAQHDIDLRGRGIWTRVARTVGRRPRAVLVGVTVGLLACAAAAPMLDVGAVRQTDIFRTSVDSVAGQRELERFFPDGAGSPATVVATTAQVPQVVQLASNTDGVSSAQPGPSIGGRTVVQVTFDDPADSQPAEESVQRLRGSLDEISPELLVGGPTASALDLREASNRDLRLIVPVILLVVTIVLAVLLRAVVAPLLLVVANVLSFAATLGVAALVFGLLDLPSVDPQIPLYAFVFLVALGVDYSIFLMTRAREESGRYGTRRGTLLALAVTGGVITSAGIVLAATFSALVVIPLLFLLQVAFLVAFGVLLDTLVVRSLLVPALTLVTGPKVWWPSRLAREEAAKVSDNAAKVSENKATEEDA